MVQRRTEVLIVGAGPAGLATAIALAQQEIDFIIVDALPSGRNTSRAAVIHAATLQSLRRLSVADSLISAGLQTPHFRVRDRDAVMLHIDFSVLPSPERFALMIPQDETESVMVRRLEALGRSVHRSTSVTRIERTSDGVSVEYETNGSSGVIRARRLVGADGENSIVRSSAGIAFPGRTQGSFMLADVRMSWPFGPDEVTLFFSREGTLVVAPMSGGRHRVVAQLPNAPSSPQAADVQRVVDARGPRTGAVVGEVLWGSRFQVHHKLASTFRSGPAVLVGDAAHVHSPAGGQGMNLGLRDAVLLSDALAATIRSGSETPLDAYADERRAAAKKILTLTDRLTRMATLSSPAGQWARNRMLRTVGALPAARSLAARTLAGLA